MGDGHAASISKVEEYVRKFGGADNFFGKIVGSLKFPFSIINVDNFEVEVSNFPKFQPGQKCYKLFYDRDFVCDGCPIEEVIREGKGVCTEMGGKDVFAFPIFGAENKVVSVIKYAIERKEVEKEVIKEIEKEVVKEVLVDGRNREIEESFYNVLQNSNDLVYRYDFKRGEFEYVSESVYVLTGFSLSDFASKNYDDFLERVHPEDKKDVSFNEEGDREVFDESEYRWKCKDGEYKWFFDKRIWFFDKNGRREAVIGNMKDISEDKIMEMEKKSLEDKVALMMKKEVEANDRVELTEREKVVLWGFCRWPDINDEELAGRLDLKRSTLTAIKNRLKSKGWFTLKYIPNFAKLGCQFLGLFDGRTGRGKIRKLNLDILKDVPEIIFCNYQDEKFSGVFVSDKYVEFRKFLEKFEGVNRDALGNGFNETSLFFGLEDFQLRDLSGAIDSVFGLERGESSGVYDFAGEGEELNINEKRVLHAMVKDPEMSSAEIAKKVWVSKPTVIKIRNKLIDEGFLYPYIVPNLKKLGFGFFGRFIYEFDSNLDEIARAKGDVSRVFFRVVGSRRIVKIVLFRSVDEYLEEIDLIKKSYRRSGVEFRLKSEIFPIQKRGKFGIDAEPFVNDLLFRDEV